MTAGRSGGRWPPIDTKAISLACVVSMGMTRPRTWHSADGRRPTEGCLQQVMRCCIPRSSLAEVTDKKLSAEPHNNPSSCSCSLLGQLLYSLCGGIFSYIERFHHLTDSTYFLPLYTPTTVIKTFCVASFTKPKQQNAPLIRNPRAYPPHVRQELSAKGTHPPFPVHDVHQGR